MFSTAGHSNLFGLGVGGSSTSLVPSSPLAGSSLSRNLALNGSFHDKCSFSRVMNPFRWARHDLDR